ncbi:6060_t:CDS:2 [Cetraspora pellucida]|uniref:6060_t:CDS:1 n=1 Tax=Cetraspora pellucida TaxID=1433469 RepID=A0A9N9EWS7_9GLOM|nr:6060_t:CDS:2 [Cetraspora pellucida]
MSKDLTKPFFHEESKDDIDGFLFDYEQTKLWVRELIRTKNQWADLKDAIIKIINAENDDRIRINWLRTMRQGEKETVRGYASRFEAYVDTVKNKVETFCPTSYVKAKDCALQIETFQKDREQYGDRKSVPIVEEKSQSIDTDIDNITAALRALTINRVKQETNEVSRIDKIEADVREMARAG